VTEAESDRGNGEKGLSHVDGGCVKGASEFPTGFILGDLEHVDQCDL
jgi:hypothetical protein